jgi:hypothetical protein
MFVFFTPRFGAAGIFLTVPKLHHNKQRQNLAPVTRFVIGIWSGRADLNRGPPAPKVNSRMLSSCLVYVFRARYITVYGVYSAAIVPKLFPTRVMLHGVNP